ASPPLTISARLESTDIVGAAVSAGAPHTAATTAKMSPARIPAPDQPSGLSFVIGDIIRLGCTANWGLTTSVPRRMPYLQHLFLNAAWTERCSRFGEPDPSLPLDIGRFPVSLAYFPAYALCMNGGRFLHTGRAGVWATRYPTSSRTCKSSTAPWRSQSGF